MGVPAIIVISLTTSTTNNKSLKFLSFRPQPDLLLQTMYAVEIVICPKYIYLVANLKYD